jgi:Na+-translocating ferredoxin:NAD+ oxidoreductase RnfD subunit
MSIATVTQSPILRPVSRFLRTPKGLLLVLLGILLVPAIQQEGAALVAPGLVLITGTAVALDLVLVRWLRHHWIFPSGAILTGLIISFVLSDREPAYVEVTTAAIAILSKHLLRTRWSNVFNPAALALVVSALLFDSAQSWWGALPDFGLPGVLALLAIGLFIADHVNKLPVVLSFLAAYFLLFTGASFVLEPGRVAEIFRAPDVQAVLFFAFIMVDDPPTCSARYSDQVQFGILVALTSYVLFVANGAVYFLPAGLLLANAWETSRRWGSRLNRRPVFGARAA